MSGDDRSWLDGEKPSFSDLDRRRRERRSSGEQAPRSKAARERSEAATSQYLKEIDGLFSHGDKARIERLVTAMRDARGTPGLADACRAYHEAAGLPSEAPLISLFLDTGDGDVILLGYESLRTGAEKGVITLSGSLRSQLRILAEDPDDAIAEGAEELLEAL